MYNHLEQTIITAVRAGGQVVKRYFHHRLKIHEKTGAADFYTRADIETEKKILKILHDKFPSYNVDTEEAGRSKSGSPYSFIIDPIDGTNNFALGISYFAVAIVLLYRREPIFSVVYNPIAKDLYIAKKGMGAYHNEKKLKVSKKYDLAGSVIIYVSGYSNMRKLRPMLMDRMYENKVARVLDNWCPTLDYCLFAAGLADGVITNDDDVRESSIGWLFIKEAGGFIYNYSGQAAGKNITNKFICVNNPKMLKQILPLFK